MNRLLPVSVAILIVATLSGCSVSTPVSFDRWSSSAAEIRSAPYKHEISNPLACQNFLPIVEESILKMDDIANERAVVEDLLPLLEKVGARAVEIGKYPTYTQEVEDLVGYIEEAGERALELRVALIEKHDVRELFDHYALWIIEIEVSCEYWPN